MLNSDTLPALARYLFVLAGVLLSNNALAINCGDELKLTDRIPGLYVAPYSEYFEDPEGKKNINDILSQKIDKKFKKPAGLSTNFGISTSAYWLRFDICNEKNHTIKWYLEAMSPFIDYMDVYQIIDGEIHSEVHIAPGDTYFKQQVFYRHYLLDYAAQGNQRTRIYVMMKGASPNLVDMSMRIWTPKHFHEYSREESIAWGIFYGGMIIMVLYNFFIYLTVKDRAYLYYVLYLPAIMIGWMTIAGHGHEYFWPNNAYLKLNAPFLFTSIVIILAAIFSRKFLNTQKSGGLNDKILLLSNLVGILLFASVIFEFYTLRNILGWNISLVLLVFVIVGFRVYRSGYTPARFYLTAWVILLVGSAISGLVVSTGHLSSSLISEMSGPAGAWFEAAFLSFALADRIRVLQKEKQEAQSKLIQAQIEPHFLFNTLANISSLTDQDTNKAKHMLGDLDTYLRTTLARTREGNTTLKEELELIKSYLSIIKIRMGDRLQYEIDIPEEFGSIYIPPLLLQPLVENAIKHGLDPKVEGGRLLISGNMVDGRLKLVVSDNGVGLSDNDLSGIGLNNVRERINMVYGRKGKLEIYGNTDGGVTSSLTIPI